MVDRPPITPTSTPVLNPILLVHGINDTTRVFRSMESFLRAQGWEVHSFNMTPNNGDGRLEDMARQVEKYVQANFAPEQRFNLIGFSMGGVISRYYLQRLQGMQRVDRFINISAPNYGTQAAYFSQRPGCRQMRPDSELLQDLNQDHPEIWNGIKLTSIWTPLDLMILPAQSCQMPLSKKVVVPVAFHGWMVKDKRVLQAVADALLD